MIHFLGVGLILGVSAGLAPGPLVALVISETLRQDVKAGIKVALSPLISDLPIVVLSLFILAPLAEFRPILGAISVVGGIVVFRMGLGNLKIAGTAQPAASQPQNALLKGILVNILSPHPYLFWISVGAPIIHRAMAIRPGAAVCFAAGFYLLLVGSKIGLALLAGRSRNVLNGRAYIFTMRGLGAALCLLALILFKDGLQLTGIL